MPPRAARAPKKDSVAVAVKKNLTAKPAARATKKSAAPTATPPTQAAPRSRVSRRKTDVVPQEAPEWQQQALKTAAAAAKLQTKNNKNGKRGAGAKAKKSSPRKGKRVKGEDGEEDPESSDASDSDDVASAASEHESEESAGNARSRGKKKPAAKRSGAAASKAAATGTPKKCAQKPKVAELLCPRCKLRLDQWAFCGLSGEPHVVPEESTAETEAAAPSPVKEE